jgi:hypothetical protein
MAKHKHNIPANLIPEGDLCVPLFIPHDTEYVSLVVRALRQLTLDRHYDRDENHSAIVVREQFDTRMYQPFIDALADGTPCGDGTDSSTCFRLDATSEIFQWYPNDPFTDPDNLDDDKQIASLLRWNRWGGVDETAHPVFQELTDNLTGFLGYFESDAILSVDPAGLFANPITKLGNLIDIFTSFPFPYVMFEFSGTGQIEVEILNVPLGGTAVLIPNLDISLSALWDTLVSFVDDGVAIPQLWQFAETNRDVISVPPETLSSLTVEFEFTEDTDHTLHVVFIPRIDDAIPFVFPFGGIREVEACGNITFKGQETGNTYTSENYKVSIEDKKGFIMATTDDLYDALVRWTNERANRWLQGYSPDNIISGVTVDKDTGEITVTGGTGVIPPEYSTTEIEQKAGGYYNQAVQLKAVFDDANTQITAGWTQSNIEKAILFVIALPTFNVFTIADYFTADPQISIDVNALAEQIFCAGDFRKGLFLYASDVNNHTESEFAYIIDLASDIPNKTISQWYFDGKNSPSNLYTSYECYRQPAISYTYDLSNPVTLTPKLWYTAETTQRIYRVEIDVNQVFIDDNGHSFDGVYYVPSGGSPDNWCRLRLQQQSGALAPLVVPTYLNGTGKYVLQFQSTVSPVTGTYFYALGTDRAWGTAQQGDIDITIYDLGAV